MQLHLFFKTTFLFGTASALFSPTALSDIVYYDVESSWQTDAPATIRSIDLFTAMGVALADEVAAPPTDGDLLGTNVLTFSSSVTNFDRNFQLTLLESADFQFRTSGNQLGLEPASGGQEDFEQTIGANGTYALAMQLDEHQATDTTWEFFDAADNSLGSFVLTASGSTQFHGVVSDTRIKRAVLTHSSSENFGIGTQYFTAVPEPSSTLVLTSAMLGILGVRRRKIQNG